jgi:hypothetical protein
MYEPNIRVVSHFSNMSFQCLSITVCVLWRAIVLMNSESTFCFQELTVDQRVISYECRHFGLRKESIFVKGEVGNAVG